MGHKWIIDVLADLRSFAQENDLELLADHLAQTAKVASAEIEASSEGAPSVFCGDGNQVRFISERARAS